MRKQFQTLISVIGFGWGLTLILLGGLQAQTVVAAEHSGSQPDYIVPGISNVQTQTTTTAVEPVDNAQPEMVVNEALLIDTIVTWGVWFWLCGGSLVLLGAFFLVPLIWFRGRHLLRQEDPYLNRDQR